MFFIMARRLFACAAALPTYVAGVKSARACFASSGISKSATNEAKTSLLIPSFPRVRAFSFSYGSGIAYRRITV